jgi:hypothetical protein
VGIGPSTRRRSAPPPLRRSPASAPRRFEPTPTAGSLQTPFTQETWRCDRRPR